MANDLGELISLVEHGQLQHRGYGRQRQGRRARVDELGEGAEQVAGILGDLELQHLPVRRKRPQLHEFAPEPATCRGNANPVGYVPYAISDDIDVLQLLVDAERVEPGGQVARQRSLGRHNGTFDDTHDREKCHHRRAAT